MEGVNIGDVGKIVYDGKFIFLFNIFLNANNPANRRLCLPDFVPLGCLESISRELPGDEE